MIIREAVLDDLGQIFDIRFSVKENVLSNRDLVTEADCIDYLTLRGKGWVCDMGNSLLSGFAIVDLQDYSVWALFVRPEFEGQGIGAALYKAMMDWYFCQTSHVVWLSTGKGTRAESFYRKMGWKEKGVKPNGEVVFELYKEDWERV